MSEVFKKQKIEEKKASITLQSTTALACEELCYLRPAPYLDQG